MEIVRVLNTNAVVTVDKNKREIIVTGPGLGFRKKKGDSLDETLIDKTYKLQSNEDSRKLQEFVMAVSEEYLDIVEKVVEEARKSEGLKVKDTLYVTLTDHINSAVERYESGIVINNALKNDIEKFYPKEFSVGKKAISWIKEKTGVDLGDDEAAFAAMHIVASETEENSTSNVRKMTELITAIVQIARLHFKIDFHENSFSYQRFITHLRFFAARVFDNVTYKDSMSELYNIIIKQNEYVYSGVQKVAEFIKKRYNYILSIDESFYLMIHLKRILDEEREQQNTP